MIKKDWLFNSITKSNRGKFTLIIMFYLYLYRKNDKKNKVVTMTSIQHPCHCRVARRRADSSCRRSWIACRTAVSLCTNSTDATSPGSPSAPACSWTDRAWAAAGPYRGTWSLASRHSTLLTPRPTGLRRMWTWAHKQPTRVPDSQELSRTCLWFFCFFSKFWNEYFEKFDESMNRMKITWAYL